MQLSGIETQIGRQRQETHSKAVSALKKIVASGRQKASDGSLLPTKVLKTIDLAFYNISQSSWTKKVAEVRSHYSLSAAAVAASQGM